MGNPAVGPLSSVSYCPQCGGKVSTADRFCTKCGAPVEGSSPVAPIALVVPGVTNAKQQEFERHLRVAWSCLKDVENKADEIRNAKGASDRQVNEGTFRGTMAMTALQGKLEREFHENLDMASKSAQRASEIIANGAVEIDGVHVTPGIVFGAVCGLRGV